MQTYRTPAAAIATRPRKVGFLHKIGHAFGRGKWLSIKEMVHLAGDRFYMQMCCVICERTVAVTADIVMREGRHVYKNVSWVYIDGK